MGIKRVVDTDLWTDEKVENYTPEEKYFWLFLLTNPYTKQLGVYHITKKQMSFHLGYDVETINKLLERFENNYKTIKYIDSEIAIKNYLKHSIVKGGKPVMDCLKADLRRIKHKELINWVFNSIDTDNCNKTVLDIIYYFNNNDNDNDSIVDESSTIRRDEQGNITNYTEWSKKKWKTY